MIATYAAALAVIGASLALGQAALALCGARRWSWLAPAVGLSLLCAVCWATVRLPGEGVATVIAVLALVAAAAVYLRGRLGGGEEGLRSGLPVALIALAAASLPFVVESHFGILGTGFNPDMSQHLLATDRLASGSGSQLLREGYPLGPHAVVVALDRGLGTGLVPGFTGLTVAAAVLAPLTALSAFDRTRAAGGAAADRLGDRALAIAGALVVGLAYLVASYFAQGAFKETVQALLVLAFLLALREGGRPDWAGQPLRFVPAALIAVGSVYVYSFPGLIWLAAILLAWLGLRRELPARPLLLALAVFAVGSLPELGRAIDFQSFETFDPAGPGLGNLFGQVSPFTALGIWPSGDFRVAPGDGAAPAVVFYLGAAFATVLLLHGLARCLRRREHAVLAGVGAAVAVYAAARLGGTPYTAAKALEVAAPVLALAIVLPLSGVAAGNWRLLSPTRPRGTGGYRLGPGALLAYLLAAGACSLLALANAPVGPSSYSPALTSLRGPIGGAPTLVLADHELLAERHGERYIYWELRGGRICVEPAGEAGGGLPPGIRFVIAAADLTRRSGEAARGERPGAPPFEGLRLRRRAGPYALWERPGVRGGPSPCPLVAVRQGAAPLD